MGDTITNGYRAYMLRLRRTAGAQPAWRASLDEVATGERRVFATLDEMLAWLHEETGDSDSPSQANVHGNDQKPYGAQERETDELGDQ